MTQLRTQGRRPGLGPRGFGNETRHLDLAVGGGARVELRANSNPIANRAKIAAFKRGVDFWKARRPEITRYFGVPDAEGNVNHVVGRLRTHAELPDRQLNKRELAWLQQEARRDGILLEQARLRLKGLIAQNEEVRLAPAGEGYEATRNRAEELGDQLARAKQKFLEKLEGLHVEAPDRTEASRYLQASMDLAFRGLSETQLAGLPRTILQAAEETYEELVPRATGPQRTRKARRAYQGALRKGIADLARLSLELQGLAGSPGREAKDKQREIALKLGTTLGEVVGTATSRQIPTVTHDVLAALRPAVSSALDALRTIFPSGSEEQA